ncbi:MAG: methanogen output domain 1-containing protein [Gammaproteobacteria bacterium]|nr:MAG: methanogen output domain 1-containing protein [Gammaproteobacteria bacterium]
MAQVQSENRDMGSLPIPLERDVFMRNLIRELSGLLEDMVGLEEAAGFISVVGQHIGTQINNDYRQALKVSNLNRNQIAQALVDLKQRIKGDFYIIEENDTRIILGNRTCPFADKVKDRPSLCMMTSNIFGVIAAENHGYGKVSLEQTIAQGDPECRVVVYLESSDEAQAAEGREYYKTEE